MANYGFNVKIGADTREFEKGIKALGKSVQGIGTKLKKAGDDFKWISTTAAAALGGIVKTSVDFEDAWVGVTKTVEGTEEQLSKVRQEIIDMSKATGISKNEIAGVAQVAGQLGIATDDLSSFTKVMLDLGIATNMSAEEAATSLARLANITQMSSKDYDRLGSTITDLGNKFATSEQEIVEMATRLASTGNLVGLTQPQIMALATAMSSLGSEAEAGGTAMSKLFRKMQLAIATNNDQLAKFAEVSGVSVKDFKKAFEKDALGALNLFVKGLAKIQNSGGSAIATLDDMKLSEVRLSDATLRLVGSGELLDKAIATANKAWDENTALTKEATKRYNEVKYQWGQVKETIGELAIQIGEVLLPILKKALTNAQKWLEGVSKKLRGMSATEIERILKVLAQVALIAPTLKVAGSTIEKFGKAIMFLSSPANLAAAAIGTLLAGMYAYAKYQATEITSLNGLAGVLKEEKDNWNALKQAREQVMANSSAEITTTQNLAKELDKVVDSNGKIKEGYENRAKVIIGELQKALGIEINLNDNVIENYKDVAAEIENVIRAKKAEAVLTAYQEEYGAALKNQAEAVEHLVELEKQWGEANANFYSSSGKKAADAKMQMDVLSTKIKEQTELVGEYGYTIQNYENLQEATIEGTAEAIDGAIQKMGVSFNRAKEMAGQSLEQQIISQQQSIEITKQFQDAAIKNNDEYTANILGTQLEGQREQLKNLFQSLTEQTATIHKLTPQQISAFEKLAEQDVIEYKKQVQNLSPEMQKQLEDVTGIVATNTSVPDASRNLGEHVHQMFKENAKGEEAGRSFDEGAERGIRGNQAGAFSSVRSFASGLLGAFKGILGIHSPSKETALAAKYFVEGFTNGITANQYSAINSVRSLADKTLDAYNSGMNMDTLQSRIDGEMIDKTKVVTPSIAIYTQQLDDQKLEQIVRYVDRRFGAAY